MAASVACMWNSYQNSSPPVVSCSYGCYEIDEDDINKLKEELQVIQTSQSIALRLSSERYTLSRMLYKVNNQQRRWKFYQMLKKIQKCLIKLQANHPTKFIDDAACSCQINRNLDDLETSIHLPSRQMLEFILTKLMGQAKLCAYILNLAEMVFVLVVQSLSGGEFISHNTIYATIVSRIWVVMRAMLKDFISWYDDLRLWVDRLKAMPMQWMPAGEVLPQSLREWIRADYDPTKYTMAIKRLSTRENLLDNMFTASQVQVPLDPLPGKQPQDEGIAEAATPALSVDLGEPVQLEDIEKGSKGNSKRKWSTSESEPAQPRKKLRLEATGASKKARETQATIEAPELDKLDPTRKRKVQKVNLKKTLMKKLNRLLKIASQKDETDEQNSEVIGQPGGSLVKVASKRNEPQNARVLEKNSVVKKKSKDSCVFSQALGESTQTRFQNIVENLNENITKKTKREKTEDVKTVNTKLLKLVKLKKNKSQMISEKNVNAAEGVAELLKTKDLKMVANVGKKSILSRKKVKDLKTASSTLSTTIHLDKISNIKEKAKRSKQEKSKNGMKKQKKSKERGKIEGIQVDESSSVSSNSAEDQPRESVVEGQSLAGDSKDIRKPKDKMRNKAEIGKSKTTPQAKLRTLSSGGASSKLKGTARLESKSTIVCDLADILKSNQPKSSNDDTSDIDSIFACLE